MGSIRSLSQVDSVSGADAVHMFVPNSTSDVVASLSTLADYFATAVTNTAAFRTVYAQPNATAFNVTITDSGNIWLKLTPTAGFDDGEVTLLASTACVDGQELVVSCTQAVDSFVVDGNGATVQGAPTQLVADDFFRLRFDAATTSWTRIG